ncbi:MAG TPA: glycosyltransferase, partial [Flavobacteriaceae bacterium]|nr:glycosyltransferase [Flavobacteriaceae bacterium]
MQKTCIIVPCYNEEKRFPLNEFINFLQLNNSLDICLVNDGSTDKTITILNQIKNRFSSISVFNLNKNKGKAEAIRYALLNLDTSKYHYIGYLDADLSTSLNEMERLTAFFAPKNEFIMGSRIKKLGSSIKRNPLRHILGRILATFVSAFILKIPVYDTQCGAKLISTPLA